MSSGGKIMFGLFKKFGDRLGKEVIEKFFISMIEELTIKDLELAVNENISLLSQAHLCNPRGLSFAEKMAKQFNGQKDLLTLENVLVWTKERREDLYWRFINDLAARSWLDSQVAQFKSFLWE